MNSYFYARLIFNSSTEIVQWIPNSWCRANWICTYRRMTPDLTSTLGTKINSNQMIVLNVEAISIKLLGENIGEKLHDIGIGNDFLEMTPKAHGTKRKKKLNWTTSH